MLPPRKLVQFALGLLCLLVADVRATNPADLYTRTGTDPTFQQLIDSGVIVPGVSSAPGPVLGSTINVDNTLLAQQTGPTGPIPQDIRIHTQVNSSIGRANFHKFTRWYQEDGNVQIMRLFEGEQNVRSGVGEAGTPGRIEAFFPSFAVSPGTWSVWEGTYTIIEPLQSNIFQLFHEGGQLWAFHLRMSNTGSITFNRRREIAGLPSTITIATGMVGKSISLRVRANGTSYEVLKKVPFVDADWVSVTTGSYTQAVENKISFRWGMYYGSQAGQSIPKDGLLFVSGVSRITSTEPGTEPPPPPPPPVTYYWDNNGTNSGFGNATGVWGEITSGNSVQGWSTNASGTILPGDVSTTPSDPLFFGTNSVALGSGTITVSDTVGAADLTFGSLSGNITLSGGEIAMSGNRTILVAGTGKTHTIRSGLSGAASITIGGGSTLVLTGENSFTGQLVIGDNTSSSLRLRIDTIGDTDGQPSAAGAPASAIDGVIQIGVTSNTSTLELTGSASAQSTNRRIRVGSNGGGSGGATILNNNPDPAHSLTFTNATFNVAATDTSSFNRTLTLGGSNTGDNTIQGAIIDNVGTTGGKVNVTKAGNGTWVLTRLNTYTGATTITAGTLRIGDGSTAGSLPVSSTITNNGTLEFRRSNTLTQGTNFSAASISGTGSLVQSGTGATILNVANTYQGVTTINAGALRILHAGALGSTGAGTVVNGTTPLGGPRLELAGGITVSGEAITISGGGTGRGALTSQSGTNEWAGTVTVATAATRIGANDNATLRVSGRIDSGGAPHGLMFRGGPVAGGGIILSGANTYLGDTTLMGKLQLDGGDNRLPVITRLFTGNLGDRSEFDLNGRNQILAGLALNSGVSIPANNLVTNTSATLSTLTVNTATGFPSTFGGSLGGNLALTKTGPDRLTLSGVHSHSGLTFVQQGTLSLPGAAMQSPIDVAPGAALAFTLGSPATSAASVDLADGTVAVLGSVDGTTSYRLMTASGGITGTPTLQPDIPAYKLALRTNGTELMLVPKSAFEIWSQGALPGEDSNGDGVPNVLAWALGAANPGAQAARLLPTVVTNPAPGYLGFVFTRSGEAASDPATTLSVEYAPHLTGPWTTASHDGVNVVFEVFAGGPADTVTVWLNRATVAPAGALFLRLRVTMTLPAQQ